MMSRLFQKLPELIGHFIKIKQKRYHYKKTINKALMEPQQIDQPHTLCQKCNNFILTPNFLIHEARCKGNNRQSSTYTRNSRISNIRNSANHPNSDNQVEENQRIPCPFCAYAQTLAQLDTHPNVCPHREVQCQLCHLKFPVSLMDQHELVCTARGRNIPSRQEQDRRVYEQNIRNSENQNRMRWENNNNQAIHNQNMYGMYPGNNEPSYNRNYQPMQDRNRIIEADEEEEISPTFYRMMEERRRRERMNMDDGPINLFQMLMGGLSGLAPVQDPSQRQRRVIVLNPGALIQLLARRARQGGQTGLTKEDIKKFPITRYVNHESINHKEDEDMCAICYCNFEQGENCMNLPCKHKFHPDCIGKWLQKNPTCPLCKKNFKPGGEQPSSQRGQNMPIIFFDRVNLP